VITASYVGLFAEDGLGLKSIKIPMIQRDYALGRDDQHAKRIRRDFIKALVDAVTSDGPTTGLDFVYGKRQGDEFVPLDGQQRLTTLFLLHWYLVSRCGGSDGNWLGFSYDTRASARDFCEQLREAAQPGHSPDFREQTPAAWLEDQAWFMPGWREEPTIKSMLVVLDALHEKLAKVDPTATLARLTDHENPAIAFHVLELGDMALDEDVYIHMNSRGKPLTDFEIFKARFVRQLAEFYESRREEFEKEFDGVWLDTFWKALPRDNGTRPESAKVDAAMLGYMRFIADFVDAKASGEGWGPDGEQDGERESHADVCLRVFGKDATKEQFDWLFRAFELWNGRDVAEWFANHLGGALPLFDPGEQRENLFVACSLHYDPDKPASNFPTRHALLLHAILWSGLKTDAETMRRLRMVRNLAQWSENEFRPADMGKLIAETESIMANGLPVKSAFNAAQLSDENSKHQLRQESPDLAEVLDALEDHNLLRGRLRAIRLDRETLRDRAASFQRLFDPKAQRYDAIAAALLTAAEAANYTDRGYATRQFVPAKEHAVRWRDVINWTRRNAHEAAIEPALEVVLAADAAVNEDLDSLVARFLAQREEAEWFDWRYYFVRYSPMRAATEGCYGPVRTDKGPLMGYCVRRHNKYAFAYGDADPYLDALSKGLDTATSGHVQIEQTGQPDAGQRLRLVRSGIFIASAEPGWHVHLPEDKATATAAKPVFDEFGLQGSECGGGEDHAADDDLLLRIQQDDSVPEGIAPPGPREVRIIDREDRIKLGQAFVVALAKAGC
jgi:hypothetical protein